MATTLTDDDFKAIETYLAGKGVDFNNEVSAPESADKVPVVRGSEGKYITYQNLVDDLALYNTEDKTWKTILDLISSGSSRLSILSALLSMCRSLTTERHISTPSKLQMDQEQSQCQTAPCKREFLFWDCTSVRSLYSSHSIELFLRVHRGLVQVHTLLLLLRLGLNSHLTCSHGVLRLQRQFLLEAE